MVSLPTYKNVLIEDLHKFANNSRTHSQEQIKQVFDSINEFGFTNPLLIDNDNKIIAGHCRLEAAKLLKMVEVPCIVLDNLTEVQKQAYVIADNKLALNAGWDMDILQAELLALSDFGFDLTLTGFGLDEIGQLFPEEATEGLCNEDAVPETPNEPICKLGDVWVLGAHKLLCGDSTVQTDVDRLMGGVKADMVFTDPPYNVAFNGRSGKFDVIKNDDLLPEEFDQFIKDVCSMIHTLDAPYYIWCNWKFYGLLQNILPFTACIVWAKNNFGLGKGYRHQHEFCLTNASIDDKIKHETDLWSVSKDTEYMHPTQKPVELAMRAINNHKKAMAIVDLFGGSGSTLIACEKTKRQCYMMELDPKYCDVIIKRYEQFTGNKAILEQPNDS